MRTVFVVTHPEATHHVDAVVGGWYDSDLTPSGRAASVAIAERLRAVIPEDADAEVFTSDLRRAVRTANDVSELLRCEPVLDRRLREMSYGEAEGKPQTWLSERFVPPPVVGDRMHHDEGLRGAETRAAVAERVYAAMDEILASSATYQVVVTHGFALTFVVASWLMLPTSALGHIGLAVAPGSITILREDDYFHNRVLAVLGDTGHLPSGRTISG